MQIAMNQMMQMMQNANSFSKNSYSSSDNSFASKLSNIYDAEAQTLPTIMNSTNIVIDVEQLLQNLELSLEESEEEGMVLISDELLAMLSIQTQMFKDDDSSQEETKLMSLISALEDGKLTTDELSTLKQVFDISKNEEVPQFMNEFEGTDVTNSGEMQQMVSNTQVKKPVETDTEPSFNVANITDVPKVENVKATAPYIPATEVLSTKYVDELNAKIADTVMAGVREFEIELEPATLGKLVIKASYEEGVAQISIICTEKEALQALTRNAPELAAIIENRSGSETEIVIDKPPNDYLYDDGQGKGNPQNEQEQNKKSKSEEAEDFLAQLRLGLV